MCKLDHAPLKPDPLEIRMKKKEAKQEAKKQEICNRLLENVERSKQRQEQLKPDKEYQMIEDGYKLREEKQARKLLRANNFETKVLLEDSSDDEGHEGDSDDPNRSESTKEIRRILKSVSEDQYEARHYQMITELRIRKMLAREKIKYPTKEQFDERKSELRDLYQIFVNQVETL